MFLNSCPCLNSLKGYFENTSAIISMVIWRNHLDFDSIWVGCWSLWQSPAVFFPTPSQTVTEQRWAGENQGSFCLWFRLMWPFECDPLCSMLLVVNELGKKGILLKKNKNSNIKKGNGRAQMSQMLQLGSWLLLSSGDSCGCEWDLNSLVLNL